MNLRQWIWDLRMHMIDGNGNLDARSCMTSGKLMITVYLGWLDCVARSGGAPGLCFVFTILR